MGLTERHWFENEESELTERQLEDAVREQKDAYKRGYQKGYSDRDKEIVRCKDCGFAFYKEGLVPEGYIFCTKPGTERGQAVKPDDWFCADGKRKDE